MTMTLVQPETPPAAGVAPDPPRLFASALTVAGLQREAEAHVARALTMMSRARCLVEADRRDAIDLLTASRIRLGGHFKRYQAFKHGNIFDPVVEFGPASSKVVARTMKVDCMQLGELFGAYHARWLGMRPGEWSGYRRDMLETVEMLTGHLEAELRAMRQLLLISNLYRR